MGGRAPRGALLAVLWLAVTAGAAATVQQGVRFVDHSVRGDSSGARSSSSSSSSSSVTPPSVADAPRDGPAASAPPPARLGEVAVQTFRMAGGSAAVRYGAAGAQVVWATPNPGYRVSVGPPASTAVVIFDNGRHRSTLEAWWDGAPQHSVAESGAPASAEAAGSG